MMKARPLMFQLSWQRHSQMGAKGHEAQTFTIEVDDKYSASDREAIAEDVIDEIVDNTLAQKDRYGKKMASLSKNYAKFKRKVVGNAKANIKFTGETLGAMQFIKSKSGKGKITVGYKAGTNANAKSKGQITGEATGKVRDFLGLPDKQVNSILNKYPVEDTAEAKREKAKALKAALALRERIRGNSGS